jgi:hypothetical protein
MLHCILQGRHAPSLKTLSLALFPCLSHDNHGNVISTIIPQGIDTSLTPLLDREIADELDVVKLALNANANDELIRVSDGEAFLHLLCGQSKVPVKTRGINLIIPSQPKVPVWFLDES